LVPVVLPTYAVGLGIKGGLVLAQLIKENGIGVKAIKGTNKVFIFERKICIVNTL
jgi:predicted proteasome-type protease